MKIANAPNFMTDFLLACTLLTRLPLPHLPESAFKRSARAVWAYPLSGMIVGALAALAASVSLAVGLPNFFAAGIGLAVLVTSTGAMHEDGLADMLDGFWGGQDPQQRLEIMKDSQIGTYGTLGLIIVTGLRWTAYAALLTNGVAVFIIMAAVSRCMLPAVMCALPHARDNGLAQSVGRPDTPRAALSLALGIFPCLFLIGTPAIPAFLTVCAASFAVAVLAKNKIKGQTGDVLGATQQLSELAALASLLVVMT